MTYKYSTFFKWITVLTDFFFLNLSLIICFYIEHPGGSLWEGAYENYRLNFLLINLFWFYCSSMVRLYDHIMSRDAWPTVNATVTALVMYLVAPFAMTLVLPNFSLSTQFVIHSFILLTVFLLVSKTAFLSVRRSRRQLWAEFKTVVIVGGGAAGKELYAYFSANPHLGYRVAGFFDDEIDGANAPDLLKLGRIEDCYTYAKENGVSEIFCALSGHELEKVKALMQEADKHMIRFRLVPDLKAFFDKNVMLEIYGQMPVLAARNEPLENKANEIIKRTFDLVFSVLVITFLLSWLVPLIGLIIKWDSKGPVFFKQLRSGKENKAFYCYKFRSMTVNSDSDSKQAVKGDARITRVGAFLRKTSLDELPQFFNVLKGEMSVVGPRPHMLKHTQDYSLLINNFMVRHFLTPGITGWAQITGFRGETKETEAMAGRVEADLWYLENWSLLLDLKIIFLTVWQAVRGNDKAF